MKINMYHDDYNEKITFFIEAENIQDGISIGSLFSNFLDTILDPFDYRVNMKLDRENSELCVVLKLEKQEKLETKNVS